MAAERKRYINNSGANTAGGNGTEDIVSGANRAYLSAQEAESAEDGDLVTPDVYLLFDWRTGTGGDADADAATLTCNGTTDGPDNYVHFRGAPTGDGGRHPNQWSDSHVRMSLTNVATHGINYSDEYVRVEHLQIEMSDSTASARACISSNTVDAGGSAFRILGCILRQAPGSSGSGNIWGLRAVDVDATYYVVNTLFIGFRQGSGKGANIDGGTAYFYNCGFIDSDVGLEESGGTTVAKNTYSQDCTDGFFGTITGEFNCSDIASDAPGTSPVTGDISFVEAGSGNYQLASGDTVAKGAGTDLSADATYPFSVDMAGTTRSDWSIGPLEAEAGGGGTENPAMRRFGGVHGMSRIIGPKGVGVW